MHTVCATPSFSIPNCIDYCPIISQVWNSCLYNIQHHLRYWTTWSLGSIATMCQAKYRFTNFQKVTFFKHILKSNNFLKYFAARCMCSQSGDTGQDSGKQLFYHTYTAVLTALLQKDIYQSSFWCQTLSHIMNRFHRTENLPCKAGWASSEWKQEIQVTNDTKETLGSFLFLSVLFHYLRKICLIGVFSFAFKRNHR